MKWYRFLPYIHVILEVADARLPVGSRNPNFGAETAGKARVLLLNKADLADPQLTDAWVNFLRSALGLLVVPVAALHGQGMKEVEAMLNSLREKQAKQGPRIPLRVAVVGIPNVGKSTVINRLAKRAVTGTGALPGVTKGEQWLRLRPGLELLDTPGRLKVAKGVPTWQLVAIRAVKLKDEHLESCAEELLAFVARRYGERLASLYRVKGPISLTSIALAKRFFRQGGVPDLSRSATAVLTDFWRGKWGPITLEEPPHRCPNR